VSQALKSAYHDIISGEYCCTQTVNHVDDGVAGVEHVHYCQCGTCTLLPMWNVCIVAEVQSEHSIQSDVE